MVCLISQKSEVFSDCFLAAATLPGHKRSLTRFWQANQVLRRRLHRYRLQRGGQRVSARTSRPCRANFLPNSRTAFAPGLLLQRPHCNSESQHEVLQVLLPPKLSKSSRLPHIFFLEAVRSSLLPQALTTPPSSQRLPEPACLGPFRPGFRTLGLSSRWFAGLVQSSLIHSFRLPPFPPVQLTVATRGSEGLPLKTSFLVMLRNGLIR